MALLKCLCVCAYTACVSHQRVPLKGELPFLGNYYQGSSINRMSNAQNACEELPRPSVASIFVFSWLFGDLAVKIMSPLTSKLDCEEVEEE